MIRCLPILATLPLAAGQPFATDYASQPTLRTETEVELDAEVTEFEMTVDGHPVEGHHPGLGIRSELSRRIVQLDEIVERGDDVPTLVRRTFEELHEHEVHEGEDTSFDQERDAPLAGVTLELQADEDGDVEVTVADGDVPDDELLEGHRLALGLDALLPPEDEEIALGDSWDLDGEAVRRALGLDVVHALFPPAGREEDEERGPRRRAFAAARVLRNAEWEGEVRLADDDASFEGRSCARFELELEGSGELPEMSVGRRGRDRMLSLPLPSALDNSFEIELEGELFFDLEAKRPVRLELEGDIVVRRSAEHARGEHTMLMTSTREGTFRQEVTIAPEDEDR